jgi:hypothetical protein
MEAEVRRLFLEYGVKNVMSCVNTVSKALYEELKEIYGEKECIVQTVPVEAVEASPVEKKERKRIVKKAVEAPAETAAEPVATNEKVVEVVTLRVKKKVVPPVEVQQTADEYVEEESDKEESGYESEESGGTIPIEVPPAYRVKSAEEIRKERYDYRAAVEKKRVELINSGIKPESLLTRENLEKWLDSGMSYQRIAREITGCHESVVSASANKYGLKSKIGKIMMLKNMNMKLQQGL